MRRAVALFLTAAATLTVAAATTLVAVQQDLRMGADDVPQQLAEDGVRALEAGTSAEKVVGSGQVPIERSLAPFVTVTDRDGPVLASNGTIDGRAAVPPHGVLETARASGRDAVTWQPRSGVREAIVVLPWSGGTIISGASLRVIESRIEAIELLILAGYLAGLVALAVTAGVAARVWPRDRSPG